MDGTGEELGEEREIDGRQFALCHGALGSHRRGVPRDELIRLSRLVNVLETSMLKRIAHGRPFGVAVLAEGIGLRLWGWHHRSDTGKSHSLPPMGRSCR